MCYQKKDKDTPGAQVQDGKVCGRNRKKGRGRRGGARRHRAGGRGQVASGIRGHGKSDLPICKVLRSTQTPDLKDRWRHLS